MLKTRRVISLIAILVVLFANFVFASEFSYTERYVDNTLHPTADAEGTATGGGNDYILLEAAASGTDDVYNNYGVLIISGTGTAGESRRIIDYDATGNGNGEKYAQINVAWSVNPGADTVYEITVGSNANNGTVAGLYGGVNGAWRTIQYAADTISSGTRINVLTGRDYALTITIDINTTNGSDTNPIAIQGFTSSAGDGGIAVVDGNSVAVNCFKTTFDWWIFRDLELKGATGDAMDFSGSGSDDNSVFSVEVSAAGGDAIQVSSGAATTIINCELVSSARGINDNVSAKILYNYIHDTTSQGMYFPGVAAFNIMDTNSRGIETANRSIIINNTIYNSTSGQNIYLSSDQTVSVLLNNIFHTSSTNNIYNGRNVQIGGWNSYFGDSGGTGEAVYGVNLGNDQTGDPDLVDPANGTVANNDFNLGASTTIDDDGYPATFVGIANTTGNMEMGVAPYEETGGGGGGGGRRAGWSIQ